MVRAMNKKSDDVLPENPGKFAKAVNDLYRHAVECKPEPFQGNVSLEVRQAAFGLALIRQLLDQHAKSIYLSADMPGSGIREAYGILDHLTTGRDHPISKHIKGIHSGAFRPQHAEVNSIERFGQKIIVGLVRAYMAATGAKQAEALRQAVNAAKKAGSDFTAEQIRGWDKKFTRETDRGPDYLAAELSKKGDPQLILDLGATWIWKWWGVPMPPKG